METTMKRTAWLVLGVVLSSAPLWAADVRVKRLDNGDAPESSGPTDRSGPAQNGGVGQGRGQDRGTVRSRPIAPRDGVSDGRPATGDRHWTNDDRPAWRDNGHGQNVQPHSSGVTLGAGRTRIVRQSHDPAPDNHGSIAGNRTIIRQIERDRRVEVVPNRQYWHNDGGHRWVHTYRGGLHWYGFYHGRSFYWTRYHRDRWWWYDDGFNHWVFWSNGRWWWNGPGGALYVNVNDSYYPYDAAPVAVPRPAPVKAPLEESENHGGEWTSRDGKRMVQIHGPQAEAFLYDKSGDQAQYLAYLGKNVERVRFSDGMDDSPVRILVDFKNGDFTLFSSEGEPVDLAPPDIPN